MNKIDTVELTPRQLVNERAYAERMAVPPSEVSKNFADTQKARGKALNDLLEPSRIRVAGWISGHCESDQVLLTRLDGVAIELQELGPINNLTLCLPKGPVGRKASYLPGLPHIRRSYSSELVASLGLLDKSPEDDGKNHSDRHRNRITGFGFKRPIN